VRRAVARRVHAAITSQVHQRTTHEFTNSRIHQVTNSPIQVGVCVSHKRLARSPTAYAGGAAQCPRPGPDAGAHYF